jgi:UDP-2,3-diacylglucosamine pyrophosphatase LpxH
MLIFISDLHFVDGTAGEQNPLAKAFDYFFDDVVSIASKESNEIKEIKIVLLGDVFDLLRTEKWFPFPENERPWGYNEAAIENHSNEILDSIFAHPENSLTFETIQKRMAGLKDEYQKVAQRKLESTPRLFYIPGNHDRLVNKYSSLRVKVCKHLAIPLEWQNPADPFPHTYEDLRYSIFARHGHEFDVYNYESGASYTLPDYERVPIGDPITTELVARLPYEVDLYLQGQGMSIDERRPIKARLQEIENVRPLGAVIEWLLYRVQQEEEPIVRQAIEASIDKAVNLFNGLNYVKLWYERHRRWDNPIDEADKIQTFLFLLTKIRLSTLDELMHFLQKVKDAGFFAKDDLREAAPREFPQLDPRFRYVVYGHTHEPLVAAMRSDPSLAEDDRPLEKVYLNTGTWRARDYQADEDRSFMSWKNMTYVIFYRDDERKRRKADFETWTGALK